MPRHRVTELLYIFSGKGVIGRAWDKSHGYGQFYFLSDRRYFLINWHCIGVGLIQLSVFLDLLTS